MGSRRAHGKSKLRENQDGAAARGHGPEYQATRARCLRPTLTIQSRRSPPTAWASASEIVSRSIFRKELREYRRHASILWAVAIFPLIFLIQPLVIVFVAPSSSSDALGHYHLLLYMLAIPVLTPAMLAGYAVAGERQQGTLEPVLTTPVRREEFLLGKALAVLVPSTAIAYGVYVVFVACVALFALPGVSASLLRAPDILGQVVFTPLLAAWSTWVGIAVSTRSSDVRVAQQLSLFANMPLAVVTH